MTWGLWDDLTIIDARWLGLSNDATATAWRACTWARGPGAKARPGFVTERQLRALSGSIGARAFKAVVNELLDAGQPTHPVGILEPVEGGYMVHGPRVLATNEAPAPTGPAPQQPSKLSRSEAGRLGGAKSAESRRTSLGSAQPAPKQTPPPPEANVEAPAEATPKQNESASKQTTEAHRSKPETTDQVASKLPVPIPKQPTAVASNLSGSAPEAPASKQAAAASESASEQRELPSSLAQALELPICTRAAVAVEHPERAEWLQPHKWPEVMKVAEALHAACGLGEVRLGVYGRDTGVRAIVGLFASGYMPSDLQKACRLLPGDAWWTKADSRRGLASLSPEVVRRVLATGLSPAQEARVARAMGERPPSALGDLLPKVAGGEP